MGFDKWLDTFISEKGIDTEQYIEVEGPGGANHMPVSAVLDAMKSTTDAEKSKIKNTFVLIDFKNGDVLHFIKHLAQAIAI